MTINPSTVSVPQPLSATSPPGQQWQSDGETLDLTRTTSSATLDGEPKIFPGVVSRSARRSSMRSGPVEEGAYAGYRAGEGSVAERDERDSDED